MSSEKMVGESGCLYVQNCQNNVTYILELKDASGELMERFALGPNGSDINIKNFDGFGETITFVSAKIPNTLKQPPKEKNDEES